MYVYIGNSFPTLFCIHGYLSTVEGPFRKQIIKQKEMKETIARHYFNLQKKMKGFRFEIVEINRRCPVLASTL